MLSLLPEEADLPSRGWMSNHARVLTYQNRLAGPLYAIETQEERRGIGRAVWFAMPLGMSVQALQKERDTVLGLVVDYFRHFWVQVYGFTAKGLYRLRWPVSCRRNLGFCYPPRGILQPT